MKDQGMEPADSKIEPLSFWKVEKLLAGELPDAEAAELRQRISASPKATAYLERMTAKRSGPDSVRIQKALGGGDPEATSRLTGKTRSGSQTWTPAIQALLSSLRPPRAIGLGLLLILGLGVWMVPGGISRGHGMNPKGPGGAAFRLIVHGAEYDPQQVVPSRAGDTLLVKYRSPAPVFAEVWYQEERGEPGRMSGGNPGESWDPAPGWKPAPRSIVLDGDWKRQTLWLVWSSTSFSAPEAAAALAGRGARADVRVEAFRLARPE